MNLKQGYSGYTDSRLPCLRCLTIPKAFRLSVPTKMKRCVVNRVIVLFPVSRESINFECFMRKITATGGYIETRRYAFLFNNIVPTTFQAFLIATVMFTLPGRNIVL